MKNLLSFSIFFLFLLGTACTQSDVGPSVGTPLPPKTEPKDRDTTPSETVDEVSPVLTLPTEPTTPTKAIDKTNLWAFEDKKGQASGVSFPRQRESLPRLSTEGQPKSGEPSYPPLSEDDLLPLPGQAGSAPQSLPHAQQSAYQSNKGPKLGLKPQPTNGDAPFVPPPDTGVTDRKPCRGSIKYLMEHPYCRVPKWLKEAETEGEVVFIDSDGKVTWEKGTWKLGEWRGDIWKGGLWKGGVFYSGIWHGGTWQTGDWRGYIWHGGTWHKGEWQLGIWKGGEFKSGLFRRGIWQDGQWYGLNMTYSLWEKGIWNKGGGFVRSLWMDGVWYGDAEGIADNSSFQDSLWRYGHWFGGDFKSGIWENGYWHGGEFHEGLWKSGIWKDGLWWELSDSFWKCGIWEGGQWGWPAWMAHYDRVNAEDCDLSQAGVLPAFLTEEQNYTFIPEEQIYRCLDCPALNKKVYHLKPGCRGTIKELSYKKECAVPKWLKEASTLGETVAIAQDNTVIWEDGVWHNGHWKGGIWKHGVFANGIWEDGLWENGMWGDNIIQGYAGGGGLWVTGIWKNGLFREGLWLSGVWKHGYHANGDWFGGVWEDGKWENGTWYRGKNGSEITGDWRWLNWLANVEGRTLLEAMEVFKGEEYFSTRPKIKKRWEDIKSNLKTKQ